MSPEPDWLRQAREKRLVIAEGPAVRLPPAPAVCAPAPAADPAPVVLVAPAFGLTGRGVEWTIPLRLDPVTNGGALKKRLIGVAGRHRRVVGAALARQLGALAGLRQWIDGGGRLVCTITRLGGREMDLDNLAITAKWCRDTVSLFLGVSDGPTGPIGWDYAQQPGGPWGVKVRLGAGG